MNRLGLYIGHRGDAGQSREINEDSYLILTPPALAPEIDALLVVADGMGGHWAGDVASHTLATSLEALFTSADYQQHVAYGSQHADYYVVVLKEVLERVNEQLYSLAASRPELAGMGTTATVVLLAGGYLFWGHAGDSRAYLMRNGALQRLTRDHTWVAEQVEAGRMLPEEAANHPRRNVLTQSLGNSLLVRVERGMQPVQPGDMIFLCSDGLSGVVSEAEIQQMLLADQDVQAVCERLVTLANQRGGPDNITVLLARLTANGPGSNVAGGHVRGPVQPSPPARPLADTLKAKRRKSRQDMSLRWLVRWIGVTLVLLLGALFSGMGALLVALLTSWIPFFPPTFVAVITFVVGALLGWLLRPCRSGNSQREVT